ncbi:Uncharacterized protein YhaN [Sulfitobacter brevis]|uniref:Uncharacterized protein YhaN n=1 Tax=Sulfitobacter brevis TaxID=74348 RepID=A0A1I2ATA8_9RHOB|nr:AAA family ATPase [Sulfitobacter brevis]SFE47224.1 Uncharacterized protein YhaN [Sulfitobacter brevis]
MRLNRLDLLRYGRFKDAEIAFPRPTGGAADVTVVFGPNEAGKSTAFHGFLELLYGMKAGAHPYAFRFERSDLLVGGELDLPGRGAVVLRRNGKRSQSLVDAQDRPLDEAMLAGALHGVTRDAYEERFSLNDKGLREGGERIAGAQGDLGQLLHAGISGLTGMSKTLDLLSARADKFHKKHGRTTVLKIGADRLKEINHALRADRLTTEREAALRKARESAQAEFKAANAAWSESHRRLIAQKAAQIWYERTDEIDGLCNALQDLPEGPVLPQGTAERVSALIEKIAALQTRIAEKAQEIEDQEAVIAEQPADPSMPALAAELERLDDLLIDGAPLMGRATTAQADLLRRSEDHERLTREINEVLADLSVPDVRASLLVLDAHSLESLARAAQDCLTAELAAKAAREAVERGEQQRGAPPKAPQDLTALRAAFDQWQAVSNLSPVQSACEQAAARLTKVTAVLSDTWRSLTEPGLPARETLEEAARNWSAAQADCAAADKELDLRASELAEFTASFAAQEAAPDAVDVAETERTRRARDMAWQRHIGDMTGVTAKDFETALDADDGARAHYLTGTEARQRLATAQTQMNIGKARYETARQRQSDQSAQREQEKKACAGHAHTLGLLEGSLPSAFAPRLQSLLDAANADADVTNAQEDLNRQIEKEQTAREKLAAIAASVGLDPALGDLSAQVQRMLTLEDTERKAWGKWQDDEKARAALSEEAQECRTQSEAALQQLASLTAGLPLADRTLDGVQEALPHLRHLRELWSDEQKLSARIEALDQAVAALVEGAERLARLTGASEEEARATPVDTVANARLQLSAALRADELRAQAIARKAEATRLRTRAKADLDAAEKELSARFDGQDASDLGPADRVLQLLARDRLRAAKDAADRERIKAREGVDEGLFEAELALLPDAARATELEQNVTDAQNIRDTALGALRDAQRLYDDAFNAADRSDLATEQATIREELRDGARQAMVARLGVLAARGALRSLATERRSSMLQDVEAAFVSMTTPAWSGVDVWSRTEGEKLVGVQPGGTTVPVEQMSTGTMGQLYFALRLAGYRSFARDLGPLPMILDDIMETFDDTRARAALKLCAGIGETGQAILFTHHAHLVDLARDCIDGVNIVNIPA